MKKILYICALSSLSAFSFAACDSASSNASKTVLNINTNTVAANASVQTNSNVSSNTNTGVSTGDQDFLNNALSRGFEELQMSGIAVVKAQNEEVRAFAQKMINTHSKANKEIKEIAELKNINVTSGTTGEQQKEMSEMSKLSGAAFDKEYIKKMVANHEKDVAEYQKQANGANDTTIKKFAAELLPTLKEHQQTVRDIQNKIK